MMENNKFETIVAIICFIVIMVGIIIQGNTNNESNIPRESSVFTKGKAQLEQLGYTDIIESGSPLFCCGEDDSMLFSTGFVCKNKRGITVEGCFCSAPFKGVTVRFK